MRHEQEARPWGPASYISEHGRSRIEPRCPFCGAVVVIYLWSLAGCGKKKCSCGAALYRDGVARKLVEVAK